MLAACAGSAPPSPTASRPILPTPAASFGAPVVVRPAQVGEDARAYAAREKAGRLQANARLVDDRAFYEDVVRAFGAP